MPRLVVEQADRLTALKRSPLLTPRRKGAAVSFASYAIGFLVQGIYFVILARVLGAYQYGLFVGALALATILSTMSGIGAGNVLVLRTARDPGAYPAQFATALVYVLLSAPALASIGLIACAFIGGIDLRVVLIPLLVSELVFARLADLSMQIHQAHERLAGAAVVNISSALARLLALLLAINYSNSVSAASWSQIYALSGLIVGGSATAACCLRFGRPRASRESLRTTWRIGIHFAIGMSSRIVFMEADKYVLAGANMSAVGGAYAASNRLVNMAFSPIQAAVYSSNTHMYRIAADYRSLAAFTWKILRYFVCYAVFAYGALTLLAPLLPRILGADFSLSEAILPWVALALMLQTFHYVVGDALMALGEQRARSMGQATVAVVCLVANVILIPRYGWHAAVAVSLVGGSGLAVFMICTFARMRVRAKALPA
jgi:O-antigen/teichoic acid export membrane protein